MPKLNIVSSIQAYADSTQTASPLLQLVNWTKKLLNISVTRPSSRQYFLDPNQTLTIFDGQRSTAIDGTTAFTVTLSPLSSSRYRITNSAGTAPAFRTARALSLSGIAVTFAIVANGTVEVSVTPANTFVNVQVGDQVWIPGVTTGDATGPFNQANEGLWSVLAVSAISGQAARKLTLKRLNTSDPEGSSETVTPPLDTDFIAFSAAGVQPDDHVEFASSNWSQTLRSSFLVDRVTPTWFEIISTESLPLDVGVLPSSTGLIFYNDSKRFVRVEADQEAAIRFNGDSGSLVRISPLSPADPDAAGWIEKFGPTWSLAVVNRTPYQMTLTVIACE